MPPLSPCVKRKHHTQAMTILGRSADAGVSLYRYDAFNRMTSYNDGASEVTYTDNGDGLRMNKNVGGTTISHIWDGTNIAVDVTSRAVTNQYDHDRLNRHDKL